MIWEDIILRYINTDGKPGKEGLDDDLVNFGK